MDVLYVVGSCLTKNTSANMSHNGYVQGLLENGCQVDILMAEDSWGAADAALPVWQQARYFCYPSISVADKLRQSARKLFGTGQTASSAAVQSSGEQQNVSRPARNRKGWVRALAKRGFYTLFPTDPLYPLERTWLKKAHQFSAGEEYDLVVSNSSPAASHKLVADLLEKGDLCCKRWVQLWEDPWFADLYSGGREDVRREEHALLKAASEVYYVSPLTLDYQKELFSDCARKMKHIPLPYLDCSETELDVVPEFSFGYFGDFYSRTRNLLPFYQALRVSGYRGYIYGDTDLKLDGSEKIEVSGRVTLDKLISVQEKTGVLVHLCNLRGGQIPGKVYHYSATRKPILFILDGTEEEKSKLFSYFKQFDRYYFCENTVDSIRNIMDQIRKEMETTPRSFAPVEAFSPQEVVRQLLTV